MDTPSRAAAYSELVAGLLDVRDQSTTERFDEALRAGVASGRLDPATAAELRWLQRESVQAVVDHARTALPPALLGIDEARAAVAAAPLQRFVAPEHPAPATHVADADWLTTPSWEDLPLTTATAATAATTEPAMVRRLLVAGLTSLTGVGGEG
jgi:hypothetical protein